MINLLLVLLVLCTILHILYIYFLSIKLKKNIFLLKSDYDSKYECLQNIEPIPNECYWLTETEKGEYKALLIQVRKIQDSIDVIDARISNMSRSARKNADGTLDMRYKNSQQIRNVLEPYREELSDQKRRLLREIDRYEELPKNRWYERLGYLVNELQDIKYKISAIEYKYFNYKQSIKITLYIYLLSLLLVSVLDLGDKILGSALFILMNIILHKIRTRENTKKISFFSLNAIPNRYMYNLPERVSIEFIDKYFVPRVK